MSYGANKICPLLGHVVFGCGAESHRIQQQLEHGTFADFAMVKDGHLAKIPDGKTFEGTASMGAGVTTVRQALYHDLKMPWRIEPAKKSFPILIYGASTASGTVAIQHAKL